MQDLLDAEAEVPHAIPRRQASFARGTGDMSAKAGSGKSQFRTPTAAGSTSAQALARQLQKTVQFLDPNFHPCTCT